MKKDRFEIISFYNIGSDLQSGKTFEIGLGASLISGPYVEINDHWKDWLGSIIVEKINNSNLTLVTPVEKPSGFDIPLIYNALIISTGFVCDYYPILLSVQKEGENTQVDSFSLLPRPGSPFGTPNIRMTDSKVVNILEIHKALHDLAIEARHTRIFRGLQSFIAGFDAIMAEDRIQNFTRCIEAFIAPEIGRTASQFQSRTSLFIGDKYMGWLKQIYNIRSNIEHMHHPFYDLTPPSAKDYKNIFVGLEMLCRYLVTSFLLNNKLWEYFADDQIVKFWKKNEKERISIWIEKFDIESELQKIIHTEE